MLIHSIFYCSKIVDDVNQAGAKVLMLIMCPNECTAPVELVYHDMGFVVFGK